MGKNLRNSLIVLAVLVLAYLINLARQSQYKSATDLAFEVDPEEVVHIQITNPNDTLNLIKTDQTWSIQEADSLVIRQNRIDDFFDKVLQVRKETLVSRNPDKWALYSVDDSAGVHVRVFGKGEEELGHIILGRAKSDWARNNIRVAGEQEVYLTNENILYRVTPRPSFWGEKPKPPAPPDTTQAAPDTSDHS
ncbi:MAG: DUF4340 domain-containing protein [Candidatus Neomarinimicrobiota bacterium]|nr:MAG: DUF4340 domain-containing protein [Candidatus Neomarinimicrobiota bacterium]